METFKRTPLQLFNLPQHFVIPLFQRPYVWNEADQWEPLWSDIRRVAELRMREPHLNAQHFLGAVVLQAHEAGSNNLTTWNVIDGQQRLTTLQLLMDAASAVFTETGVARAANQLEWLTHNSRDYVGENASRLKLRHLNNDHAAFDEVMTAEPPVDTRACVTTTPGSCRRTDTSCLPCGSGSGIRVRMVTRAGRRNSPMSCARPCNW
ncbi:DUF262 domain-containing protein [Nostocoides veronense]|uniref:GmrSD restriction endonucleases N-terminal domain-containing protein n=1 Tax=Nostocoides veronense TaxID=330836 RepID=A0ABN2M1R6_9MICO